MAALPAAGRRALEQLRLIADDASSAELLAERALAALDGAVPFDDGALFAVDGASLLFNRLLAYRGQAPEAMRAWLRDTYLVAREPGSLHFPTLLRRGGGAAAFHGDGDRWLRALPPPVPAHTLSQAWRSTESPAGGALRYGLAHRRRWIAALQLARLEPGRGFRAGELELLDRAAPMLARALSARLTPAGAVPVDRPPLGQAVFDERRRLVSVSASGERWIGLLAPDAVGPAIPVALQALVGDLAGSGRETGQLDATDRDGGRVALRAEPALRLDDSGRGRPRLRRQHRRRSAGRGPPRAHRCPVVGRAGGRSRGQRSGDRGRPPPVGRHGARARGRPAPPARHQHPREAGRDARRARDRGARDRA